MEPSRSSRRERDPGRRHRSRSFSIDSEERRQRRRRKERELADRERGRGDRSDRESSARYDDKDRGSKRRRSRSPPSESSRSRRHEDRDSRHKSTRHRSSSPRPKREDRGSKYSSTRNRSPRSNKDQDFRSSRDGSATQLTRKNKGPLPSQAASFQANGDPSMAVVVADKEAEKQKPNLAPTGLLAAATKTIAQADGTQIVLKYHEPAEARKPPPEDEWKLFVFKGSDILETIELSTRSCWLVGRELSVVDMPAEHPSVSKQHAVIQFRYIEKKNEYGDKIGKVRPYLIDLDSANGTLLNKEGMEPSRYVELRDKDMIQFGHSTREYVLMLSPQS